MHIITKRPFVQASQEHHNDKQALMDLYKRACFDFERYVEVVPRNLREFSMDIIVSEIRVFQKDTNSRNLGSTDNEDSIFGNSSNSAGGTITDLHENYVNKDFTSADVTPFVRLRFTHCEFDKDSLASFFGELTKNLPPFLPM